MYSSTVRTASAPWMAPFIAEPSRVTSSARSLIQAGKYSARAGSPPRRYVAAPSSANPLLSMDIRALLLLVSCRRDPVATLRSILDRGIGEATIANLLDDCAAGLPNIDTVMLNGKTIPEVDAGYVTPTPIDT